jgi:hypothetical protein
MNSVPVSDTDRGFTVHHPHNMRKPDVKRHSDSANGVSDRYDLMPVAAHVGRGSPKGFKVFMSSDKFSARLCQISSLTFKQP